MDNAEEFGYFAKTVSEKTGVGKDTLRNWSLRLESDGAEFERNARGQRIYYEKDIRAIQNMKELLDLQQPLNSVSKIIAEKMIEEYYNKESSENNAEITLGVLHDKNALITGKKQLENFKNQLIQEFTATQKEAMDQFKKEVSLEMANTMQNRLEETINQAVKIALLKERKLIAKEVVEEMNANKLQIATSIKEPEKKVEKSKGIFAKLFGK
jgi:DNA-binding transcriptional MerR regulator